MKSTYEFCQHVYLDRFPSIEPRLIVIWSTWSSIFLSVTNAIFTRFVESFLCAATSRLLKGDRKNSEEKQQLPSFHKKYQL